MLYKTLIVILLLSFIEFYSNPFPPNHGLILDDDQHRAARIPFQSAASLHYWIQGREIGWDTRVFPDLTNISIWLLLILLSLACLPSRCVASSGSRLEQYDDDEGMPQMCGGSNTRQSDHDDHVFSFPFIHPFFRERIPFIFLSHHRHSHDNHLF